MTTWSERPIAVDPVMLMYAFRYALGRKTYCVSDVADALIDHKDSLTADWRQQIVQDINNAIANGDAGDVMDAMRWREVAETMK